MTTYNFKRIGSATLTGAALLLVSFGATAASQRSVDVLTASGHANDRSLPKQAKAQSGVSGTLNPAALGSPSLKLTLADGTTIEARLQRTASNSKKGTQSWIGTFDDAPGSVLVLSKASGVVTGYANYKDQTLEIVPASHGKHLLYAVDSSRIPSGDGVVQQPTGGADALATSTTSDYGLGASTLDSTNDVVQDVLVLYTAAAASAYGKASLESMITSAIESGNQAYQNSLASVTINVVGLQQSTLTESSSGMQSTLSALKQNSTVRSLRDQFAADMVVLVSQDGGACGYSSLQWTTTTSGTNYEAYAVVATKCLSSQSLAHELGHLQGLDHNRENKANSNKYPYSFGYRVCTSGGFRDIMSYPCSTAVPRVLQFSNPNVDYNGYATGVSYEASPSTSAENARTLNNNATTVAAYRVGTASAPAPTSPTAPSALAVQGSAYNSVTVGWTDNSTNESGFKVQRSPDGVTFTEIASVGADTRSFSDASVSARTAYYYRVRAWNSVGGSALSNTVSVTTPDVPPPPPAAPSSVAARNDADGTAAVSWVKGTSTATSFEVRRETWDSRKNVWTGATTAASVPASVVSIVDSTGAGTFRYSVRAKNSGGASAYAGPASVSVTSPTSSPGKGHGRK